MIESCCKKFVVIVDESKLVDYVGGSGLALPVEVVPCWKFTANKLEKIFIDAGCVAKLRIVANGDKASAGDAMLRFAGVVEHGMFIDMATTLIVASEMGVTIRHK
nr:probable ribose-5-phosphate isomerase 2 [Tanacetum cinerariifolium]